MARKLKREDKGVFSPYLSGTANLLVGGRYRSNWDALCFEHERHGAFTMLERVSPTCQHPRL